MLVEKSPNKSYDRFRDRIMFPILDRRGRTIAFGGRIIDDGEPKYLNSPETPVFHKGYELYGFYEARQALRNLQRIVVVEGYMDVVALAQEDMKKYQLDFDDTNEFLYLSIKEYQTALFSELDINLVRFDRTRIIQDHVMVASLSGNDFVKALPFMKMKSWVNNKPAPDYLLSLYQPGGHYLPYRFFFL